MKDKNLQRRKRLIYKKINKALNNYRCLFLTISFNDKTLSKTNEKTRERYIKNYLNNETAFYIANKDYGKLNEREHYHAFIIASTLTKNDFNYRIYDLENNKNKINLTAWRYGSIRAEFIGTRYTIKGDKNYKKASEFLTAHFFKETTKNSRIIQSRKIPSVKQQKDRIYRMLKDNEQTKGAQIRKRQNELEQLRELNKLKNDLDLSDIFNETTIKA